ncbi:hypothetical protein [Sphaerisporangium perillae]|uniref:hypothetical protein n=1 Tax=Sphaerisporangium perillae TaxID=2935860 RepID=UPI00200FDF50|nr:hypothetical protein [Sphaerisporangium perillae]
MMETSTAADVRDGDRVGGLFRLVVIAGTLGLSTSLRSYNAFWTAHLVAHEHSHYIQDLVQILDYHTQLDAKAKSKRA